MPSVRIMYFHLLSNVICIKAFFGPYVPQFVFAEIQFIESTMLYYLCHFTLKKLLRLKADKRCLIRPYILYFALRRGIR